MNLRSSLPEWSRKMKPGDQRSRNVRRTSTVSRSVDLSLDPQANEFLLENLADLDVWVRHGTHLRAAVSAGVENINENGLLELMRHLPGFFHGLVPLDYGHNSLRCELSASANSYGYERHSI